jgi:hypothetical protein
MNAKQFNWLLIAAAVPFLMGCPKSKPNVVPEPDTDVQSSIDASYATFLVSDIDMICSFIGEDNRAPKFYLPTPDEDPNSFDVTMSAASDFIAMDYHSRARKTVDSKNRYGTVKLVFASPNPNARYYREYEFIGEIRLSDYRVDEWIVKTAPGVPCYVHNRLTSANYDATKTNLSWLIEGSFIIEHTTDPSRNMTWTGKLIKTLTNTSDPHVFNPDRHHQIDWSLAKVEYAGSAKGVTSGNVPYTYVISDYRPLVRDFTCSSDKIGGMTRPANVPWNSEFHPFISGEVSFNTGDKYQRQIYYGNEGEKETLPEPQCDNSGEVLIKGNSYRIDFMK